MPASENPASVSARVVVMGEIDQSSLDIEYVAATYGNFLPKSNGSPLTYRHIVDDEDRLTARTANDESLVSITSFRVRQDTGDASGNGQETPLVTLAIRLDHL